MWLIFAYFRIFTVNRTWRECHLRLYTFLYTSKQYMQKCFCLAYKLHWYQDQAPLNFLMLGGIPKDIPVGNMGNIVEDVKLPARRRKKFSTATIHRRGWEKQWSSAWYVLLGQCRSDTPKPQISHNPLISFSPSFKNNSTPKYLTTRCWYLSLTQTWISLCSCNESESGEWKCYRTACKGWCYLVIDASTSKRDCTGRGLLIKHRTFCLWVIGSNLSLVDSDQSLLQFKISVPHINEICRN